MAGTGISFSSTPSSSSSPASTSSSLFSSASAPSSSPFPFSFSNPTSTSTSAPSSSPSFGFGGFGASTTSSSSASPAPSFGFASSTTAPSPASSPLFGSSSSGSGFTSSIFGSASSSSSVSSGIFVSTSSSSTASSAGSPLFGAASFGCGSATSYPLRASTLFGSSASSSASGSTSILLGLGSGSSGSLFGSNAASCPFGSSASSPASGFSATTSASSSPFSSGLFGSSSSALGVSSSVPTATASSFSSSPFGSSASSPASGFSATTSASSSPFSSGLFGSSSSALGVSSSVPTATASSFSLLGSSSSFSPSTKLPAAGSSTQPQSTAVAPLSGALVSLAGKSSGSTFCLRIDLDDEDEKVQGEGEQVSECVLEQPVVEMDSYETNHSELSVLGQDQGGESDSMKDGGGVEQDSESYSVACGTTIYPKEPEAILSDDWGKQPIKDVAESPQEISENSSVVSKNHDEFSAVGQDQGGKSYPVQDVGIVEQDYESLAFACNTTIHDEQLEAILAVVPAKTISLADFASVIGDAPKMQLAVVDMGKQQPIKDVIGGQEETSETSSVVSEAKGDEVGLSTMGQAFSAFSRSGLTNLTINSSDAQMIIRSIFDKHGDITRGSVVKSLVMRSTLLQAVTEVVHRLCNHTMNSLGFNELQLMQSLADDAAAVGFSVDWLQERLKKVSAASKYHECRVHLERLGEQINVAMKSLMEMELQQLVWKNEVDCLKAELKGIDFEGSNLGEGLI